MGMAIVHVVGALVASCAFGVLVLFIVAWEEQRIERRRRQDASIALGVPVADLEDERLAPKLLEYASRRCSAELLRNRLSDLAGALRTGWGWLGNLVQLCIVVGVFWAMYSQGHDSAVVMWMAPAASVFFWLASLAFSFACLVLTGRYPGEAKAARKALAAFLEERGPKANTGLGRSYEPPSHDVGQDDDASAAMTLERK
ncbi:hypothetical protein [Roseateles sp. P5_E4]